MTVFAHALFNIKEFPIMRELYPDGHSLVWSTKEIPNLMVSSDGARKALEPIMAKMTKPAGKTHGYFPLCLASAIESNNQQGALVDEATTTNLQCQYSSGDGVRRRSRLMRELHAQIAEVDPDKCLGFVVPNRCPADKGLHGATLIMSKMMGRCTSGCSAGTERSFQFNLAQKPILIKKDTKDKDFEFNPEDILVAVGVSSDSGQVYFTILGSIDTKMFSIVNEDVFGEAFTGFVARQKKLKRESLLFVGSAGEGRFDKKPTADMTRLGGAFPGGTVAFMKETVAALDALSSPPK